MKKILTIASLIFSSLFLHAATDPNVNERVLKAFNQTFTNAENVSWNKVLDYYEVKFKQNTVISKVTYDENGNIIKTLRYYYEANIPLVILTKLKAQYPDHTIFGVTEESSEEGVQYHIVLEDEKNWIHINSDPSGYLTLDKAYKKA